MQSGRMRERFSWRRDWARSSRRVISRSGEGTDLDLNVALREPAFRLGDLGFVGDQEAYGAVIGQLFEDAVYKGLGDDEHLLVF